jgi:hypothetical protein
VLGYIRLDTSGEQQRDHHPHAAGGFRLTASDPHESDR